MLTNAECKSTKSKEKPYKVFDGGGLYLHIMPNGSKYWRLKYRYCGKEKLLSLGTYPVVTLSEAREKRLANKKLLANGLDPSLEKKKSSWERTSNSKNTFVRMAHDWLELFSEQWSKGYYDKMFRILEKDIFPFIGTRYIDDISTPELLDVLRRIEKRGSYEIAGKARQICNRIFAFGIQSGLSKNNPATNLNGAMKKSQVQHYASIEIDELPLLLKALNKNYVRLFPRTRRAILLSLLTFVRPGELRQAKWEHIDLEKEKWVIPASHMKMKRDHIIPLAKQSIDILKEQHDETGHINTPYVFPSQKKASIPMSDGTVNLAIKKLGFGGKMTAHGFRALARTAIREELDYPSDIIEVQLAHKASGSLGEAYNRAKFIKQRVIMMQEWADFIDRV